MRQVRAFITVAQLGSFTRAAGVLHVSQPALTVQIRGLEQTVGNRLLDRNSRGVALTRVGSELLPALQRLLEDSEAVMQNARELGGGRRGTVRIAALPSFAASLLPDLIRQARRTEPELRFDVRDAVASAVNALVRNEEVDIGITGGELTDPDLDVLQRARDRLCLVLPAAHPLARPAKVKLKDVVELPLILTAPGTSIRAVVDAAFARAGRQPNLACEPTYMMTAVAMVRAGLGVTILPGSAREIRAEAGLKARPIDDPTFVRPVALIRKKGRTLPPVSAAFAEACARALNGT